MVTIVNWSSSKKLLLSQLLKRIKHQHGDNAMMGSYFLPFKEWLFGICSLGCGDSRSAASSLDTQGHLRSLHTTAPCRHHHHREHLHYQWFIYSRVWKFIDQVFNALARRKPAAKKNSWTIGHWTLDRLASSSELMKQGKVLQVKSFIVRNLRLGAVISMKTMIRGKTLIGRVV